MTLLRIGKAWADRRIIVDQLSRFRFYIDTLEKFISEQETAEVTLLETQAGKLNEKARGEFWAWHYPDHWNEIFRTTLRSSFLISVMSFAERTVIQICSYVEIATGSQIGVNDLRGNLWKRAKRFLEAFGNFEGPGPEIWASVSRFYEIRNLFVHNGGVPTEQDEKRFLALAKSVPGFCQPLSLGMECEIGGGAYPSRFRGDGLIL